MVKHLFIITLCFLASIKTGIAAETATKIFSPHFKTLKVGALSGFMDDPVIRLGTDDRVFISFDEISEDNSFLEYRLVHCNSDWQPSRLVDSEFTDGFNSVRIEDYAFSTATFVHYVNYRIELPNEEMRLLHSGNFLLQVYDPDEPDRILLQARFQVSEGTAAVSGSYSAQTDRGYDTGLQQVRLAVDTEPLGRINPYQDLKVVIMQNHDLSTQRTLPVPLRMDGAVAIYDHQNQLIFPAGNEFRRFEYISNNYPGLHVDSMRFMGSNYHVWLTPDTERNSRQYSYDRTQHGRFLVREYNATESDIAADYVTVHFRLDSPPLPELEIFVDGEFSNGLYGDANRMEYDPHLRAYTAEIPLKQGNYNYRYTARKRGSSDFPSPTLLEGDKHETDNEYSVDVYYRPPGARADRLASHMQIL